MTHSEPMQYARYAIQMRKKGNLEEAGIYYTASAHGWLMKFRQLPEDVPEENESYQSPMNLGRGVQNLLLASLCYRMNDNIGRCRNHCRQGILITEDLLNCEDEFQKEGREPQLGLLHEIIGDFHLFADLDGYAQSYNSAMKYYDVDNQLGWQAEPEFESLINMLIKLASSVDHEIDNETEDLIRYRSLTDRIEYKKSHYPDVIKKVIKNKGWEATNL